MRTLEESHDVGQRKQRLREILREGLESASLTEEGRKQLGDTYAGGVS